MVELNRYLHPSLHELSNGFLTREGIPLKALSGLLSGAIGAAIANPTDLIKSSVLIHLI